jgi:hypothetical protein
VCQPCKTGRNSTILCTKDDISRKAQKRIRNQQVSGSSPEGGSMTQGTHQWRIALFFETETGYGLSRNA